MVPLYWCWLLLSIFGSYAKFVRTLLQILFKRKCLFITCDLIKSIFAMLSLGSHYQPLMLGSIEEQDETISINDNGLIVCETLSLLT